MEQNSVPATRKVGLICGLAFHAGVFHYDQI